MRVMSRGWSISYSVAGVGPAVMLVPGSSQWAGRWVEEGYVEALSRRYRVLVVDPLGHGESDKPHVVDAYQPRELVADLVAVLDDAGVDTVTAWGYSLGVQHVTDLASVEPSRVRSVVCGSGGLRGDEAEVVEIAKHMSARLREPGGLEAWWAEIGWVDPDLVAAGLSHNDAEALACCWEARPGWRPERITSAPALAYWGSAEDVPDGTADFLDAVGIEHHEIRDANHVTCFDRASDILSFVAPFLQRTAVIAPAQ
jgi:pimeloyl-ACP methyl ester carboxylesterase